MPDPFHRIYRVETVTRWQGVLMQNVFHVATKTVTMLAPQLSESFYLDVCIELMKMQVHYVYYEALIVTCLEPTWPEMYYLDLENRQPPVDVTGLPSPIAWKWTGRNAGSSRNQIGGFYLGGLQSPMWTHLGEVSTQGHQAAALFKQNITRTVLLGGSREYVLGTFSRTLRKKFPTRDFHSNFFPWLTLNYNKLYTSQRKRVPGVGR